MPIKRPTSRLRRPSSPGSAGRAARRAGALISGFNLLRRCVWRATCGSSRARPRPSYLSAPVRNRPPMQARRRQREREREGEERRTTCARTVRTQFSGHTLAVSVCLCAQSLKKRHLRATRTQESNSSSTNLPAKVHSVPVRLSSVGQTNERTNGRTDGHALSARRCHALFSCAGRASGRWRNKWLASRLAKWPLPF